MDLRLTLVIVLTVQTGIEAASVLTFVHDLIQNNVAGVPVIHERTQWEFDPDLGKQRRVQFEALNGKLGEDLIARLGMGVGFKGPWGTVVGRNGVR
ncbi:uncharacterized protein LOC107267159 [Cephus cinctus]|uniref:Uncharacterized protein LOC107267159 n=1 Tax=Cephus cinctus TaxID=211228 RepID=A0AAJ7BTK5_CEPCN|nr:uncharacterized protein LOC107267159 [Cephus cinctus]